MLRFHNLLMVSNVNNIYLSSIDVIITNYYIFSVSSIVSFGSL